MHRFLTITIALFAALTLGPQNSDVFGAESGTSKTLLPATEQDTSLITEILQRSDAYFARFPFMRAEDVYARIVQGRDNSYLLVSVQSPEEYAQGHVPGAVNIPMKGIATAKALAQFPRDKKIVFTCDNGHNSMAAALFLGQLGFETYAMSMGLSYWNGSEAGIVTPYPGSAGYPVSTENTSNQNSGNLIDIADVGKNGREAIIELTKAILSANRNLFIDKSEVYAKAIQGGDKSYLLVSLQRPEDYAMGHVPGAINIPYSDIAKADNLRRLPRDKKIVLICYVGHWAGSAALLLNQLGYEAYDMRFGTLGWNDTTAGLGESKEYLVSLGKSLNLPVEKGIGK